MTYTFEYKGQTIVSRVPKAVFYTRMTGTGRRWTIEEAANTPRFSKASAGRRAAKKPQCSTHIILASCALPK